VEIDAAERRILTAVRDGARLADARAAHGYQALQSAQAATASGATA
jgi:hypothetical protein